MKKTVVLSLVERGWPAARKASLEWHASDSVNAPEIWHVIKGQVKPELLTLIRPHPGIRVLSLSYRWFWPTVWRLTKQLQWSGRLAACWVDNDRSEKRLKHFLFVGSKSSVLRLQENENGVEVVENLTRYSWSRWREKQCASP